MRPLILVVLFAMNSGCSEGGSGDGAQADAAVLPSFSDYAGIWSKDAIGESLVIENDCGDYWRLDFDYTYNRVSAASTTTLLLEHCSDEACAQVDSINSTLTWDGMVAIEEDDSEVPAAADCAIQSSSSTTLSLDTADSGRLRWRGALLYVGAGCAPFIPPETQGDRCEAIADTTIRRVE